MTIKRIAIFTALAGLIAFAGVLTAVPELRWRAQVVGLMATGQIDDIAWGELLSMLKPGSAFYIKSIAESRNAYSAIQNPFQSADDIAAGATHFREQCAACHGSEGAGNSAPALNTGSFRHGSSDWWFFRVITRGIEGTQMQGRSLEERSAWQLVAYLRSLSESTGADAAQMDVARPGWQAVTPERLRAAEQEPENWLSYSGDYSGQRFSALQQIDRSNVGELEIRWIYQTDAVDGTLEASPIVNDDVMIITVPPDQTCALNSVSGEELWCHRRPVPKDLLLCCGEVNRGVAVGDDKVLVGTLDAHLLALDAQTGRLVWDVEVADYTLGYSKTAAPLVVDDMVISGIAGGEYGIRGFLDAYKVDTGERVWRFHTIPGPGEPGHDTWSGESWRHGGAPTWLTGSFDPAEGLIWWGVGNPGPLYQGDGRRGDNLYSNSVIALNSKTGSLAWHFQFTPHDERDWDANQIPVLVNRQWRGEQRSLLLTANRNGFFYVLDRDRREFLLAEPFVYQNWAERIGDDGRPVEIPESRPSVRGTVSWPASAGATNWRSPAYSPKTGLFYVAALEDGRIVYKQPDIVEWEEGAQFFGSSIQAIEQPHVFYTAVRAMDPETGQVVWEKRHQTRTREWRSAGLLATAGDLIVGGDYGRLFALDAESGEELWSLRVGGSLNASPITYLAGDRQYVVVAAGRSLIALGLPD